MESENQKIRDLIRKYREHYKCSRREIAHLTKLQETLYTSIENGTGNIDFDRTAIIAKIYGLSLLDFINPKQKIPQIEFLPTPTKKVVLKNKDKQIPISNIDLNLPEKIRSILDSKQLPKQFTTKDIKSLLPKNLQEVIATSRIADTITRKGFEDLVEVGKIGRSKLYETRRNL
ncbi:helix-turn-helix domain-containing protein [Chryseobacterium indologenes]|uniref:helix-turn-helix domain-containing protein n=1 Tax=Chryseobacterium indologenes TaxID=253 RepID=UPI00102434ED|nr:helix-turn-helix transcriptional regulator [Chryseobacterium indologenes]VFA44116.1 Helix-turn-helix domain [Chryseobacterium indologenes]